MRNLPGLRIVRRLTVPGIGCLILAAGCNLAPHYAKPPVQAPPAFRESAPDQVDGAAIWTAAEPMDHMIRGTWWEMFHEPGLNALEARVGNSNQSIAGASAAFFAARALVRQSRSQLFPAVTATPSVTRSRQSSPLAQGNAAPNPYTLTEYALPFDASWEIDLWGRIGNTVRASVYEAQATLGDLESVRLTVQAEVAADYFQLRALDSETALLDATALSYQESVRLTRIQADSGLASDQDVAQAQVQFDTARAQATDLGIQRAQLEHALATLVGTPASSFSLPSGALEARPVVIPPGLPSQLLERRPDVAASERRVAEANAQIGVARAAFYPTLTLSGSAGFQSTALGTLVSAPGLVWALGSSLAQSLFDGGKRKGVTEQALANYKGTVANYRQTVLTAFQEVEDDLSTLRILAQELQQQNAAVESSRRYLALADDRYTSGLDGYLNVITAQTSLLSNQRTAMILQMEQMTANVQLIKALGGGWDVSQGSFQSPAGARQVADGK